MKQKTQYQRTTDWLKSEYPQGVELTFIDYRDYIEDAKTREELLQNPQEAYEILLSDWIHDAQYESIYYIIKEYKTQDGIQEITEEEEDYIKDWCYNNDTSDPIKDLLKNTPSEYMYYDTGITLEPLNTYDTEKAINDNIYIICKTLKLKLPRKAGTKRILDTNSKLYKTLHQLVEQAWDGGQLVILFEANVADFMETPDPKYIKFSRNYNLCIMDRGNGSGDSTELPDTPTLLFTFDRKNLHSDDGDNGYSYSGDVCGLVSHIMEDGELTNKKGKYKLLTTGTNEEREAQRKQEAQYIKNWNNGKGKCTFGDMNIKRHKETPYKNEFPCGSTCEQCGTFWID